MYLLDTCALSNLRRPRGFESLIAFYRGHPMEDFYISAVSIGEVWKGVGLAKDTTQQEALETWVRQIEDVYASRILPLGTAELKAWARMTVARQKSDQILHPLDGLISATAKTNDLQLITQNIKNFEGLGLEILNP